MAALTTLTIASAGEADIAAVAAAAGGDTAKAANRTFLLVKNDDASAKTVTLVTPKTVDGLAVSDRTFVVSNGKIGIIPLFPADLYVNAAGDVSITYSAVTSLFVRVIKI